MIKMRVMASLLEVLNWKPLRWILLQDSVLTSPLVRLTLGLLEWGGQWRSAWALEIQRNGGKHSGQMVCMLASCPIEHCSSKAQYCNSVLFGYLLTS